MLSKGKLAICLILPCLFIVQSCRKAILLPTSGSNELTIAEAKNYFEKKIVQTLNSKKLMSTTGSNNTTTDPALKEILQRKQAIWHEAYQKIISTGAAVKVPLDFGKAYAVTNVEKKELIPFSSLNYLFMYKDSLQRIHTEWVVMLPDHEWLYGNRNVYTGRIVIKDWDGNFIKQYDYKNLSPANGLSSIKTKLKGHIPASMSVTEQPPITPTEPTAPGLGILCITVCHEFCGVNVIDSRKCWFVGNGEDEGGGGDDGTGGNGSSTGGSHNGSQTGGGGTSSGGGTGAGDYPPSTTCNADPNATQVINGIIPCSWTVPIPTPVGFLPALDREETDFFANHPNVKVILDNYFREATDKIDAENFYHWAIKYWTIRPNISLAQLDNIYDMVRYQTYVLRDREPASYYWRPKLTSDDFSNYLTETTPRFTYPNGQKKVNLDAFNCHYYAFGLEYATEVDDENPKWVTAISLTSKYWELVTGAVRVGDRVMYSLNNNGASGWTHSAIVTEVDAEGYATKVSSKMGAYEIIEHHPRDIPVSYGSTEPTFIIDGKTYPSRIYWRKK